jgi:hypothetical protein
MKTLIRLGIYSAIGIVALAGFALTRQEVRAALAAELFDGDGVRIRAIEVTSQTSELNRRFSEFLANNMTKIEAVEQLMAGRIGLQKAAARFAETDELLTGQDALRLRAKFPGRTDEERYCHQVILFVESHVSNAEGQQAALVAALNQQLRVLAEATATQDYLDAQ